MRLSDGRRILPKGFLSDANEADIIRLHPDFRMIVLANRPGFPFLGNDFYASLGIHFCYVFPKSNKIKSLLKCIGDVFSVHAVENPSFDSELELLRHFGPSLPAQSLKSLVQAFSQLRNMADQGQLNYPYSTREVINVVKHLEVL